MHIYIGTFLIAFSTLALEVVYTRILSLITWYSMAFFAISTAMLGMTAGAVTVYLKPNWFKTEKINDRLALFSLLYALLVPVSFVILCQIALPSEISLSLKTFLRFLLLPLPALYLFIFLG